MALQNESEVVSLAVQPTIPKAVWVCLRSFLLDKQSGNVTLCIKDGQILSARIEHVVIVTRAEVRA